MSAPSSSPRAIVKETTARTMSESTKVNITIDVENNTTTVTYVKLTILEEMEGSGN
jgi:Iap family predicted aminopeptidase